MPGATGQVSWKELLVRFSVMLEGRNAVLPTTAECRVSYRFSLPPEATNPDHCGKVVTLFVTRLFAVATDRSGSRSASKAIVPVTCGVAMLVPER